MVHPTGRSETGTNEVKVRKFSTSTEGRELHDGLHFGQVNLPNGIMSEITVSEFQEVAPGGTWTAHE